MDASASLGMTSIGHVGLGKWVWFWQSQNQTHFPKKMRIYCHAERSRGISLLIFKFNRTINYF